MSKKPTLDIKKFHEYLYNNCDRTGKLIIDKETIRDHFDVKPYIINNCFSRLDKAGLINSVHRKGAQRNIRDYYVMKWDEENIRRVNDGNSLDVLNEVDRSLQKLIDYFFTEKNEFLDADEYGVRYTGLDEITETLVYQDLCSLKEYVEDFNEFINFKKMKERVDNE